MPPSTTTTSSTRSRPSGRWVINSTVRSPAAAITSASSRSAVGGVEVRRRLVEHQHRRVGQKRPGEDDSLALAARELAALLADERVEPVRERPDPVSDLGRVERALELVVARVWPGQADVVANGRREEVRVLAGDGDRRAHVLLAVGAQVVSRERHPAMLGIEEAQQQVRDRRLARPARPHERDPPARVEPQGEAVERRRLAGRVAGADVFERDWQRASRERERVGRVGHGRLAIDQFQEPPSAG